MYASNSDVISAVTIFNVFKMRRLLFFLRKQILDSRMVALNTSKDFSLLMFHVIDPVAHF